MTNLIIIVSALIIMALSAWLLKRIQDNNALKEEVDKLSLSLDSMDEQAKIIVRTDMELNRLQDELDKKISGLYSLQRLSYAISMTMVEDQIFEKLKSEDLGELGFEKTLGFLWDNNKMEFILKTCLGYSDEEKNAIGAYISSCQKRLLSIISENKTISSISNPENFIDKAAQHNIFKVNHFIFSPLLTKESNYGFILAGTSNTDTVVTEGDEELIKILATQLSQSLENARLFEKTWNAQQELEKKVAERTKELTIALEEVKKMNRRKTDFVSNVSHELRTPLTSIKGYAAILLTGKLGVIPPEAKERLEKINRHSDELGHIVNDLLDISRIESGKVAMSLEPYDLRDVVNKTDDLLSGQLKEKKIGFEIQVKQGEFQVLIDQAQIERVLINLIGNAMKFTPAGGKISIAARKKEGMVEVSVSDTGCGIPQEDKEVVFDEFFRVENAINQEVKGTGLGLALVRRIIEAHQGKIWVKSKMGSGSIFSFTLQQEQ